jgi:hypothetical protein
MNRCISDSANIKRQMVITEEHNNIPATVVHRITGEVSTEEVEIGIAELVKILDNAIQRYVPINLIINAKGVKFSSLVAHKTWSLGLESYPALREKINYCAFILDDSPNARAEKELMESERLKFFFDLDEGVKWLREKA